ncbi:uncharacterized protein LOC141594924 [Silene latifolia]|uniref:uncharacterized protein LOC141594924 n=1 Tax=Silene latifolia TaxID=37657 RepID=UPI003D77A13F
MPSDLRLLFMSNDVISINFRKYVLLYNSSFTFTSFGVKKDRELAQRNRGVYTFRVQGHVYHFINDILPTEEEPRYIQLYFFDTDRELWHRLQISDKIEQNVIRILMRVMEINPYTQFFRSLREVGIDEESRILIKSDPIQDQRTHNAPTASQVAAIWVDDENSSNPPRHDIVIYAISGTSHRILHYYGCYILCSILFCFLLAKVDGIDIFIESVAILDVVRNPTLFRLMKFLYKQLTIYLKAKNKIRPTDSSISLRSGRLLQQYTVDMYIKIETTRLDYIRNNQNIIRADLYQGIIDSYNSGYTRGANIGRIFILPASFIGCDRDFRRRYLCSMAVVKRYGKPDIFLTMTCNPRWPEIERELLPCEEAQNRPDLVSRVFRSKLFELKKDICVRKIFGNVAGYVYVVEFQKRGLPHAHFLIILDSESKIRTPDQYDEFVSAELPDATDNPHLFSAVVRHMMHGPCGTQNPDNPCMVNGTCKNHYPREFADTTTNGRDSYPIYRRRRTGVQVTVRKSRLNNRWVVPYNPFLLAKYDCHLNVEIC